MGEACAAAVDKKIRTKRMIDLLIEEIDREGSKASACQSLLLSALWHYNDGYFYNLIEASRSENVTELIEDENGDEEIYGIRYTRVIRLSAHSPQ